MDGSYISAKRERALGLSAHANAAAADAKLFLGVFLTVLGRWVMMAARISMAANRQIEIAISAFLCLLFGLALPYLSLCSNAMCEHQLSTPVYYIASKHIQAHTHPLNHSTTPLGTHTQAITVISCRSGKDKEGKKKRKAHEI